MAGLIYLASPYSHPSEAVRRFRYLQARRFTVVHLAKGVAIFSPIVYGYDMETQIGVAFEPWAALNDTMIQSSSEFWVLLIDGWKKSRGVAHEVALAQKLQLPIQYVTMPEEKTNNAADRHGPT